MENYKKLLIMHILCILNIHLYFFNLDIFDYIFLSLSIIYISITALLLGASIVLEKHQDE